MSDLATIIVALEKRADNLSEQDKEILVEIFQSIIDLMLHEDVSRVKRKRYLWDVNKYLKSKLKRIDATASVPEDYSFIKISKKLIYEKGLTKRGKKDIYRKFWSLLEKHASDWDIYELSNMLAYCLNTDPKLVIPIKANSPIKIIRIFKAIFNAQDDYEQIKSFEELVLRFSTESEFKKALEMEGYSRK